MSGSGVRFAPRCANAPISAFSHSTRTKRRTPPALEYGPASHCRRVRGTLSRRNLCYKALSQTTRCLRRASPLRRGVAKLQPPVPSIAVILSLRKANTLWEKYVRNSGVVYRCVRASRSRGRVNREFFDKWGSPDGSRVQAQVLSNRGRFDQSLTAVKKLPEPHGDGRASAPGLLDLPRTHAAAFVFTRRLWQLSWLAFLLGLVARPPHSSSAQCASAAGAECVNQRHAPLPLCGDSRLHCEHHAWVPFLNGRDHNACPA